MPLMRPYDSRHRVTMNEVTVTDSGLPCEGMQQMQSTHRVGVPAPSRIVPIFTQPHSYCPIHALAVFLLDAASSAHLGAYSRSRAFSNCLVQLPKSGLVWKNAGSTCDLIGNGLSASPTSCLIEAIEPWEPLGAMAIRKCRN